MEGIKVTVTLTLIISFSWFALALEAALLGFHGGRRSSFLWLSCALIQYYICHRCVVLSAIISGWVLTLQLVETMISLGSLSMYSSFHCLHGSQSAPVSLAVLVACCGVRVTILGY